MTAYNQTKLKNLKIRRHTEKWQQSGLISEQQKQAIFDTHPVDFYMPNFFIRVILFFATFLAINSGLGFIAVFLDFDSEILISILCLIAGSGIYLMLEKKVIPEQKYYQAGVDDAMLYMSLSFVIAGVFLFLSALKTNLSEPYYFLISLPLWIYGAIRFVDKLLTFAALIALFGFIFFQLLEFGGIFKSILPFVVMIISAVLYSFSVQFLKSQKNEPWETQLTLVKICSLATFYIGGNYLVVRKLSEKLLEMKILPGEDIQFAEFFYIFTICIPALYIMWGIKKHDIHL